MSDSVVVTGMAIWSPFGQGLDAFWEGITGKLNAKREVRRINGNHWVYRSKVVADIPEMDGDEHGRSESSAVTLMRSVANDLRNTFKPISPDIPPHQVGLCIGASQSGSNTMFQDFLHLRRGKAAELDFNTSFSRLSPGAMLSEIGKTLETRGPALMVSTACASGTSSIGVAYDWIRSGRVRAAYAGGLGYFSQISFSGFNILRLTGTAGCRPFDRKRDGMMLGDGFAIVSLEREEDAVRRGATIFSRIAGYSCANEAYHATSPDPYGISGYQVMWHALGCSLERLDRLDYINAHGTGTQANDSAELAAVARLLAMRGNEAPVAMSSTKGAHGHCLGGAGTVEFVAMVLAHNRSIVPPNLGLEDPDVHPARLCLVREPVPRPIRVALSNSFAFGGNVASIAIEAFT